MFPSRLFCQWWLFSLIGHTVIYTDIKAMRGYSFQNRVAYRVLAVGATKIGVVKKSFCFSKKK